MVFKQPSIYPFDLRIDEPVTVATDILVSAVCFYAVYRLLKLSSGKRLHRLLIAYFMSMGIATFLGGVIGHGFLYALGFFWKLPGWLISMISINMIERVMISYSADKMKPGTARFFSWFNIFELLFFAGLAFGTLDFTYVEIHSGYGLLAVVLGFCLFNVYHGNRSEEIKYFMIAVALSSVGGLFFMFKIGLHQWFTHADISHVFLALSAWYFYCGARRMVLKDK